MDVRKCCSAIRLSYPMCFAAVIRDSRPPGRCAPDQESDASSPSGTAAHDCGPSVNLRSPHDDAGLTWPHLIGRSVDDLRRWLVLVAHRRIQGESEAHRLLVVDVPVRHELLD